MQYSNKLFRRDSLLLGQLLQIILLFATPSAQSSDLYEMENVCMDGHYCNAKELGENHTMCLYAPHPVCEKWKVDVHELSSDMRVYILYLHNHFRNKVSVGLEPRGNPGPQPPALAMQYLSWDYELEKLAQRWADQCNVTGPDQNRNTRNNYVNQLAHVMRNSNDMPLISWSKTIHKWYDEVRNFDRNSVSEFDEKNMEDVYSYTQIVWSTTMYIGCGYKRSTYEETRHDVFICNYTPGGNIDGEPLYTVGHPCIGCGSMCSTRFPGLCDGAY